MYKSKLTIKIVQRISKYQSISFVIVGLYQRRALNSCSKNAHPVCRLVEWCIFGNRQYYCIRISLTSFYTLPAVLKTDEEPKLSASDVGLSVVLSCGSTKLSIVQCDTIDGLTFFILKILT